jgi:uncharacterized protein (DUF488 family)
MTFPTIYTIGHSTRSIDELIAVLSAAGVRELVDVRSAPRSRRHQHLSSAALAGWLGERGIHYRHDHALGAPAPSRSRSPNEAWSNEGFREYADYMTSRHFQRALARLQARARVHKACLMCAEARWQCCHRRLICDALLIRGWRVLHLGVSDKPHHHVLTPFAVLGAGHRITYPPLNGA